jgi:26S proteasome regulatory subunit N10
LVKLAKKMKKNNIAVDFVNFGEEEENTAKLEAFIANINSADNSHIVTVPAGPNLLSDTLLSTPILGGDGTGAHGYGGGDGMDSGFDFGVDPSLDPELALALRMSLEEENQRKAREEEKQKAEQAAKDAAENLGTVKEEDENTPLLQDSSKGEGSSSGADKKKKDDDKMDIA